MGKKGQKSSGLSSAFLLSSACYDGHLKDWQALDQMFRYENFHREEGALQVVWSATWIHNSISFIDSVGKFSPNFAIFDGRWITFLTNLMRACPKPCQYRFTIIQGTWWNWQKTNGLKRFRFTNNLWQETFGCPNSCPTRLLLISASMRNKSLKIDDRTKEKLTSTSCQSTCHWVDTQLLCACDHKFVVDGFGNDTLCISAISYASEPQLCWIFCFSISDL